MTTPAILGGGRVREKPFPPRRTMGDAERAAAMEVLDSDVLSAFLGGPGAFFDGGPRVQAFEAEWARRYGFAHAVSVNSWTSGLIIAMGAVGIEPGDEVIVPPYTMSATATSAMFYGGVPVFADIAPDTYCLDPAAVEAAITPRTKAICVVHLFGRPAPMDELMEVARSHGLRVIEDAAQAPGVSYRGRPVGAIGDIGGFSLNFHKHIHTGEGGMLVTQDAELAERCRMIRNHGENYYDAVELDDPVNVIGGNYRLTELQAAIGIQQLTRLEGLLDIRAELAAHFGRGLAELPGLTPDEPPPGSTHAYYVYPFKYDAATAGLSRSLFTRAVLAELPPPDGFEGTPLTEGYVRPLYLSKIYQQQRALGRAGAPFAYNPAIRYDYRPGLCPVTEDLYRRTLLLSPLIREPLTTGDVDDLLAAMAKVLGSAASIAAELDGTHDDAPLTPLDAANASDVR